jgi:hypothetical protein
LGLGCPLPNRMPEHHLTHGHLFGFGPIRDSLAPRPNYIAKGEIGGVQPQSSPSVWRPLPRYTSPLEWRSRGYVLPWEGFRGIGGFHLPQKRRPQSFCLTTGVRAEEPLNIGLHRRGYPRTTIINAWNRLQLGNLTYKFRQCKKVSIWSYHFHCEDSDSFDWAGAHGSVLVWAQNAFE